MREHDEYDRPEQAGGGSDAPPMYPGESTAIDGGDRDTGSAAEADTGRGTDAGTETRSGAGADVDAEAGAGAGTDTRGGLGIGTRGTDSDTRDVGTDTDARGGLGIGTRGTDSDTRDVGTDTDTRTDTDARTDTDTRADTRTDTDTARDTGADTERAEGAGAEEESPRLLDADDEETFRTSWREIQSRFVDDPREAVHDADALVTDVIRKLADTFADRKKDLEGQWSEGEDVDTESLRMALRQYRSFFNRLLTT
ncbi:hypothetical protein ACWGN5_18195 [Streptomyces sp. NPDC055815]